MTMDGGIEFAAVCTGFQLQFSVEREDFEKITMRSGGRTGTAVIAFTKIFMPWTPAAGALFSATRVVFGSMFQTIQCVNKPRGASGYRQLRPMISLHWERD